MNQIAVGIERHISARRLVVEPMDDGVAVTAQAREVAQVERYARITYVVWREVHDVVDDDGRRHGERYDIDAFHLCACLQL